MGQPRMTFKNQPRLFFTVLYSGLPRASSAPVPGPCDEAPTKRCRVGFESNFTLGFGIVFGILLEAEKRKGEEVVKESPVGLDCLRG